ncbi:hypothetical protein GUJ93_ZPchr0010g7477 [Zizania palustris]|uniref:Uncharacterized protein n=1 Tax=Zizania palustris TaxID=103762 RepID=A0A8J6BJW6_ZIZPA|nr:hypothetical protein GUJ93_ZPchr0010g7477 [Zizania palustris]
MWLLSTGVTGTDEIGTTGKETEGLVSAADRGVDAPTGVISGTCTADCYMEGVRGTTTPRCGPRPEVRPIAGPDTWTVCWSCEPVEPMSVEAFCMPLGGGAERRSRQTGLRVCLRPTTRVHIVQASRSVMAPMRKGLHAVVAVEASRSNIATKRKHLHATMATRYGLHATKTLCNKGGPPSGDLKPRTPEITPREKAARGRPSGEGCRRPPSGRKLPEAAPREKAAGGRPPGGGCRRPPSGRRLPEAALRKEAFREEIAEGLSLGRSSEPEESIGGKRTRLTYRGTGSRSSGPCRAAQAASDTADTLSESNLLVCTVYSPFCLYC